MSTSSTPEAIAVPRGGGALRGIGEKFAPDLHTGTGNLTVPLALPGGRNGLQPQLSLAYSTGNGNGPFGLGWALTVPGVVRGTSRGVPRCVDAVDVFVLSGAEDLVPVPGAPAGAQRYQHCHWDGHEREFRRFARVDQLDGETFADHHPLEEPFKAVPAHVFSPPTETRTWFHLGPVGDGDDWSELDLAGEFWQGDPESLAPPPATEALLKSLPRRSTRPRSASRARSIVTVDLRPEQRHAEER